MQRRGFLGALLGLIGVGVASKVVAKTEAPNFANRTKQRILTPARSSEPYCYAVAWIEQYDGKTGKPLCLPMEPEYKVIGHHIDGRRILKKA